MKNSWKKRPEWLTSMKLRASWGKNGNERIDAFRYTAIMNSGNNLYFLVLTAMKLLW